MLSWAHASIIGDTFEGVYCKFCINYVSFTYWSQSVTIWIHYSVANLHIVISWIVKFWTDR